jgi:hypothetical protein
MILSTNVIKPQPKFIERLCRESSYLPLSSLMLPWRQEELSSPTKLREASSLFDDWSAFIEERVISSFFLTPSPETLSQQFYLPYLPRSEI